MVNANEALSNANTALATAEDAIKARDEIIGKTGSVESPEPNSALEEIRQARKDILRDDGGGGIVEQVTTLKTQAEDAKTAAIQSAEAAATSEKNVKAIESKIDQANTSAAQIESFRTEMTTAHTAVINARNDILAKGNDNKSVYEKIIDAKTSIDSSKDLIIGSDGTVDKPKEGSALRATKDAQAAAEAAKSAAVQARIEAEGFAASANKGITVINSLDSTDTANALSANKGKELNESKLNLSGGTMTGTLILNGDPSNLKDAATKNYVDTQIAKKVDKVDGKGLSTNDYTDDEKTKLAGISNYTLPVASADTLGGVKIGTNLSINENGILSADAQKMTVDNTLDSNSENPVQNKVVKNALDGKSDTTHNHDGTYLKEVPKATNDTLGGIKVGTGLSVAADGTLSADAQAVNVTSSITQNSDEAVSSGAVFSRIGNLKFVVSDTPPTSADDNTFTIVAPN